MTEMIQQTQENTSLSPETAYLREIFGAEGWATKLLTPITKMTFYSQRVANAFKTFEENVSLGEQFTLYELLSTPEVVNNRMEVVAKDGFGVYMITDKLPDLQLLASLMRNSVVGICGVLFATRGVELSIPEDMTVEKFCHSRFLLLRERDGDRFCASGLVKMIRVGSLLADRMTIRRGGDVLADFSLNEILPSTPVELTVEASAEDLFTETFEGALGFGCCHMTDGEYFVNLPADLPMASFAAGCLGMFFAMIRYRFSMPPFRFQKGKRGLVVPKPVVLSGDGVFAFRPRSGGDQLPHPAELGRLVRYLMEGVKSGKIKSVLPLKKNARAMMDRLGDGEVTFVPEREFPTEGFSVLAIMPAGSDVPATKLGTFQYK